MNTLGHLGSSDSLNRIMSIEVRLSLPSRMPLSLCVVRCPCAIAPKHSSVSADCPEAQQRQCWLPRSTAASVLIAPKHSSVSADCPEAQQRQC